MRIDEELYKSLQDDLDICRDYIRQISLGMVKGNVTKYPIFVAIRGENDVDVGLPIVNRADFDISWNFNASHLEEFVTKGLVLREKAQDFIKVFKNPVDFMCVFVAEEETASFVFLPYNKDLSKLN
ncbi:MAG: hypothetical protein KA149_08385 [Chitinophagales bacterium]|nr:hypothetical protein [Chitinophagales bacterium]